MRVRGVLAWDKNTSLMGNKWHDKLTNKDKWRLFSRFLFSPAPNITRSQNNIAFLLSCSKHVHGYRRRLVWPFNNQETKENYKKIEGSTYGCTFLKYFPSVCLNPCFLRKTCIVCQEKACIKEFYFLARVVVRYRTSVYSSKWIF